jgi:hypothetical protein
MLASLAPPHSPTRRRLRTGLSLCRLTPVYLAFGVLRHFVRLDRLARWAWQPPDGRAAGPEHEARTVALAIRLGQLFRAVDRHCLQRSLLLYRELSAAGASPSLVVGFGRQDTRVIGHAWVVVRGVPIGESAEWLASLSPAVAFGRGGQRVDPA